MTTNEPLQEMFVALNLGFFDGKLPAHRMRWRKMKYHGGMCISKKKTIVMNSILKKQPIKLRRVLLHEMCHIGADGHGRLFCNNLLRLWNKGERWVWKDHNRQMTKITKMSGKRIGRVSDEYDYVLREHGIRESE
jgi:hypothetical protein